LTLNLSFIFQSALHIAFSTIYFYIKISMRESKIYRIME
jgi:hypothetical protein